ncbi:TonB-dependent receptor [Olivibacter ginsenosidimutans]|uniref:TonB-dependent receptor n=1 Tax=Olivibacter ginsenosidimutans TaxID=1176537 RepID=A0ABP9B873_9SPHI
MKLTLLLLFISIVQLSAEALAQQISLKLQNASLAEVVARIKTQTDLDFLYNNSTTEDFIPVTLDVKNERLETVLDLCFRNQPLTYRINKHTVLITKKEQKQVKESAQNIVSGLVTDSVSGESLPDVNITVINTANGTKTDEQGRYRLPVSSANPVLVFSYIGYQVKRVALNGRNRLDVKMTPLTTTLEDVVVVGYGTRAKGTVTGAISSVKSDVFENRPLNNSYDALQGALPGVTITRGSGQPGGQGYNLQTRGYSSINGNAPLVMIDGIPGDLNVINPNDIAEITVLKDAAASIYGARAADGVILVTTKKGTNAPPQITYSLNYGRKTPTYLRKVTNTLQFAEMMDEGLRAVGQPGFDASVFEKIKANAAPELDKGWNYGVTNFPAFYGYTDWNNAIYKTSDQQLHNLAIAGGGENNGYLVSLGYNRDNGNLKFGENNLDRYNFRINYDIKLLKKLSLQTRTSFESQITREPSNLENALTNVPRQFPYQPVFNTQGQFYGYQGYENPAQTLAETGKRHIDYSRFNTNFKLDYDVLEGLKLTGQVAFMMDYYKDNANYRTFTRWNYAGEVQDVRQDPNSAYYTNEKKLNKLYQLYFDYNKAFNADHRINVTGGASLEQYSGDGQTTWGYHFLSNDIFTLNLADKTKTAYTNFTGSLSSSALASYFGRLSYSFRDKLIVDVTARADGSSKFASSKRWSAVFPSVAVAYNLSQESFIQSLGVIDLLKLRASWGKMGNQEIGELGLYDYIPLVSVEGNYPLGNPNAGLTGASSNTASQDRTWETIINKNAGIDLGVLGTKLTFSFDYYQKINDDMLVDIAVPATYGGVPPSSNQGKLVTKGFETAITWKDQRDDFRYSISLMLSDNTNKLVELKNSDNYGEGLNQFRQGYPINSYFGYEYLGIIKTQEQLEAYKQLTGIPTNIGIGDAMYKDRDGDGKLTAFGDKTKGLAGDMLYLGNLSPRYTYSANISAAYKQFDLSVFLQGVGKRTVQYESNISTPNTFFWPSLAYYYQQTWSSDRPDAPYPRYLPGNLGYDEIRNYDYHTSSLVMHNVAYLRFKVITLGYNLPTALAEKIKMKGARIYVSGQDLFTLSKGTLGGNFDPEDGKRNEGTYPFNKVYSIGLNVKF